MSKILEPENKAKQTKQLQIEEIRPNFCVHVVFGGRCGNKQQMTTEK